MRHGWTVVPALALVGLVLLRWTAPSLGAEPLDDRLGIRTAPIVLLTRPDIQADLKIDPKLAAACRQVGANLRHKASALKGMKMPAMIAARRTIDDEMSQWLETNLTPEQIERLRQIDLQWEGAAAMVTRPFYDESLGLSREQRDQVVSYLNEAKAQRARAGWTFDDHRELTRKSLTILSEKQRHLWVRILGEPCVFKVGAPAAPVAAATPVSPPAQRAQPR